MANRWGNNGNSERLYFWGASKSLQMVTAAMKLKDACSLEEKLWQILVVVQFLSRVWLFVTPWTAAGQAPLSSTVSRSFAQTQVYSAGGAVQPPHPLLSPSPTLNLACIRVFSNESVLNIKWPEYWSFSMSPSNEYSGLISSRID